MHSCSRKWVDIDCFVYNLDHSSKRKVFEEFVKCIRSWSIIIFFVLYPVSLRQYLHPLIWKHCAAAHPISYWGAQKVTNGHSKSLQFRNMMGSHNSGFGKWQDFPTITKQINFYNNEYKGRLPKLKSAKVWSFTIEGGGRVQTVLAPDWI